MNQELLDYIAKLSKSDKKTLSQKALKAGEEFGELAKVVLPFDGAASTTHRFVAKERILEEVSDLILCALSVAYDLDYTDDEIAAMMMRKATYWAELQARDDKAKYPLPYEIHVTIGAGEDGIDLEAFKETCELIGVKPLLIDLHNQMGNTIMLDCQTSSVHVGDNRSAFAEAMRIRNALQLGFEPVRVKIETVPWHPAAPSNAHQNPVMPKHCYFESHFNIIVTDETLAKLRGSSVEHVCGLHISRNAFKKISDTEYVMMATLRSYRGTYEGFVEECDEVKAIVEGMGFTVPKVIVEFSVYDTNVSHDAEWIGGAHNA